MYNLWLVLVFFLMCLTMSVNDWPVLVFEFQGLACVTVSLTLSAICWSVLLCVLQ